MVVDLDSDGIPRVKVLEHMACASIFSGDPSAPSWGGWCSQINSINDLAHSGKSQNAAEIN